MLDERVGGVKRQKSSELYPRQKSIKSKVQLLGRVAARRSADRSTESSCRYSLTNVSQTSFADGGTQATPVEHRKKRETGDAPCKKARRSGGSGEGESLRAARDDRARTFLYSSTSSSLSFRLFDSHDTFLLWIMLFTYIVSHIMRNKCISQDQNYFDVPNQWRQQARTDFFTHQCIKFMCNILVAFSFWTGGLFEMAAQCTCNNVGRVLRDIRNLASGCFSVFASSCNYVSRPGREKRPADRLPITGGKGEVQDSNLLPVRPWQRAEAARGIGCAGIGERANRVAPFYVARETSQALASVAAATKEFLTHARSTQSLYHDAPSLYYQ